MKVKQVLEQRALHNLFEHVKGGSFAVKYENGTVKNYGTDEPKFTVKFNNDNVLGLISDDMLSSFGEAYMDGEIDIDGDLADLFSLALRSGLMSVNQETEGFAGTAMRLAGKIRSLQTVKENIARHYDLGNDFFRLWLDQSMTYSCAYFRNPNDTLELAQQQKIDHSIKKLRLKQGETLLDIGCGWGALVMRTAENYEANTIGITLSEEQFAYANAEIESRGLRETASVRLVDYSTLPAEGNQFDKIISIGMIEHVGKENLLEFIQTVKKLLKPGGLALLHFISGVKEAPINNWLEKYIFPGGYIPTLPEIITHLEATDFSVWDVENLAPHYRLTLDHWSARFEKVVPFVLEKFGERFVRMWRLYLRTSSAAFRAGAVEIHQILVSNGQPANLPTTREDIYIYD
jgi:cyclopropane-fatty-acyl-phospholipid synthase